MGRPSKYTPEVRERILEALRLGATRELAASAGGISRDTLWSWMKTDEEEGEACEFFGFSNAVKEAESQNAIEALAIIRAQAKGSEDSRPNWQAAAWLLERRHSYVKRDTPTVTIEGGDKPLKSEVSIPDLVDAVERLPMDKLVALAAGADDEPEQP